MQKIYFCGFCERVILTKKGIEFHLDSVKTCRDRDRKCNKFHDEILGENTIKFNKENSLEPKFLTCLNCGEILRCSEDYNYHDKRAQCLNKGFKVSEFTILHHEIYSNKLNICMNIEERNNKKTTKVNNTKNNKIKTYDIFLKLEKEKNKLKEQRKTIKSSLIDGTGVLKDNIEILNNEVLKDNIEILNNEVLKDNIENELILKDMEIIKDEEPKNEMIKHKTKASKNNQEYEIEFIDFTDAVTEYLRIKFYICINLFIPALLELVFSCSLFLLEYEILTIEIYNKYTDLIIKFIIWSIFATFHIRLFSKTLIYLT